MSCCCEALHRISESPKEIIYRRMQEIAEKKNKNRKKSVSLCEIIKKSLRALAGSAVNRSFQWSYQ